MMGCVLVAPTDLAIEAGADGESSWLADICPALVLVGT
jgi:hypothetical protein